MNTNPTPHYEDDEESPKQFLLTDPTAPVTVHAVDGSDLPKLPKYINPISTLPTATMSSVEIAELTGKRLDNVNRDVKKMLAELEIDPATLEHTYKDKLNREKVGYKLNKDLTLTLLTGYNVQLRYVVVQRMNQLETEREELTLQLAKQEAEKAKQLTCSVEEQSSELRLLREENARLNSFVQATKSRDFTEFAGRFPVNLIKGISELDAMGHHHFSDMAVGCLVKLNDLAKLARDLDRYVIYENRVNIKDYKARMELLKVPSPDLPEKSIASAEALALVETGRKYRQSKGIPLKPLHEALQNYIQRTQRFDD